jgi:hypothetical protein
MRMGCGASAAKFRFPHAQAREGLPIGTAGPPYLRHAGCHTAASEATTMMRTTLTLAIAATLSLHVRAQKHVYQDLLVLYVDEKYEKCIFKAEGYTENDATKKDPLPYLYISMCYHEMSKLEKFRADYPKAGREALKWAEKYRKKDKDLEFFKNYEDYWMSLNTAAMEEGENLMDDPKGLSKAKQVWTSMTVYYPENPGPWLMLALTQYQTNMAKEGDLSVKQFEKAVENAGDISRMPADQKKLMKNAIIRFADWAVAKGRRDQARKYVAMGKDHFMDQPDFRGLYETMF